MRLTLFAFVSATLILTGSLRAQWVSLNSSPVNSRCLLTIGSNLFVGIDASGTEGGVFLSTDSGTSWKQAGLQDTGYVEALAVIGMNLYAGTETGVYLSTNNGNSWTAVNNGLIGEVSALAVIGTNLFAGTGDGVFLSTNNGANWTAGNSDLRKAGATNVNALATIGTNLFAGTAGGAITGGVFLTTNNGASWTAVNSGLPNNSQTLDVRAFAVSGTVLYTGIYFQGVFRSMDNGASWTAVNTGLTNNLVRALAMDGTNVFVGTNDSVFISTDNGTSWTASGVPNVETYALAVCGAYLFAGTDYQVWRFPLPELDPSLYNLGVKGTVNDTVAFGRVPVGNTALQTVTPYNAGREPLTMQPVSEPGNEFATSDLSAPEILDSGNSFTFEVFFEPTDTGYHSATLTLISQAKVVTIVLTGKGYDASDVENDTASGSEISVYPNPISSSSTISLTTQNSGYADISILNLLGTEVTHLYSGELTTGEHSFTWEPNDLPDGLYECVVRMNGSVDDRSSTLRTAPLIVHR